MRGGTRSVAKPKECRHGRAQPSHRSACCEGDVAAGWEDICFQHRHRLLAGIDISQEVAR